MTTSNSEMEAYATPISRRMMEIKAITDRITLDIFDVRLILNVQKDMIGTDHGRLYVQVSHRPQYLDIWAGRRWYITDEMSTSEIIKTCYAAFEAAVRHEVLKGFKVDSRAPFHPDRDIEQLLELPVNIVGRPLEPGEFIRGEKVVWGGHVYDYGYKGQTGKAIIYNEGECNMQDAHAVEFHELKKFMA